VPSNIKAVGSGTPVTVVKVKLSIAKFTGAPATLKAAREKDVKEVALLNVKDPP